VKSLTIADVLRLAAAGENPADHLKKVFEWQVERAMTTVRAMAGAVAGLLAALVAGLLSNQHLSPWVLVLVVSSAILGIAYSRSRYDAAKELEREYLVALNVLRELLPLAPLVRLSPDLYVA
jgi:uncharacterized membrane protein YfcA